MNALNSHFTLLVQECQKVQIEEFFCSYYLQTTLLKELAAENCYDLKQFKVIVKVFYC